MKIFKWLVDFVFPRKCLCCGEIIEKNNLCQKCIDSYSTGPVVQEINGIKVYAPFIYKGKFKNAFNRFKFRGYKNHGKAFAYYMVKGLNDHCENNDFDMVVYVPMPEERKAMRGYNQAEILV